MSFDPINRRRATGLLVVGAGSLLAQDAQPTVSELLAKARAGQLGDNIFVCPMDPDVRSHDPGNCPRCGMALKAGLPDQAEYHLELEATPRRIEPGKPVQLRFTILDPWKHRPVTKFQEVHEKLFHMFLLGTDLEFFVHDHPVLQPDGTFLFTATFPRPGVYRILGDFYPDGGTPQLIPKTLIAPGARMMQRPTLVNDLSPKDASNVNVTLRTVPEQPIVGQTTQLHYTLTPGDNLEKYLAAWGHLLASSDDLIDLIHTHPFIADGRPHIQFNVVFPRARPYRIWAQFQRAGQVNTVRFDLVANELR